MSQTAELSGLARDLVRVAYLKGDFLLRSGKRSPYYFDKYLFETEPSILRRLGPALAPLLPDGVQRVAAPELGAVLLGGALSTAAGLPLVIVRKEAKDYGTSKLIEGRLEPGDRVVVVEDVLTTAGEAIKTIEKLHAAQAEVLGLVAVLDREEGAEENLRRAGVTYYRPLFRKSELPLD